MSPGEVVIAQLRDGGQPQSLSAGYCIHSEVDNGHWRIIWKEAPGGGRLIELSAEGYESIHLPSEVIREVQAGKSTMVGGLLGHDTIRMRKIQQE
jgi:hypothetical protein